jgi:ectoine hydroxylase-related dioxygenase (phytanoyl-CoA dioxygenase family)
MTELAVHIKDAAPTTTCAAWLSAIERHVANLSEYSSSLRLRAVPEIDLTSNASKTIAWCETVLGGPIVCDLDECWVRRQYAPKNYPRRHAPHSWHQDGALRFDFKGRINQDQSEGLLEMATCWLALTPCGLDAPGLELIVDNPEVLVAPANLTDEEMHRRFATESFLRPEMETGDALLFRGEILHRTHVNPSMTRDRTSLELRFFPADRIPDRLKRDHFVKL